MEQNENTAGPKPFYGPPETPAIFRDKWLSKFRQIFYITADNLTSSTDTPAHHGAVLIEQYVHLQHFYFQARNLSLDQSDFPTEPPLCPSASTQIHLRTEEIIATRNPFDAAVRVMFVTDAYLEKLQEMKFGKVVSGWRWAHLPLGLRRRVNEILDAKRVMEEEGKWPVSKESREVMATERKKG